MDRIGHPILVANCIRTSGIPTFCDPPGVAIGDHLAGANFVVVVMRGFDLFLHISQGERDRRAG